MHAGQLAVIALLWRL